MSSHLSLLAAIDQMQTYVLPIVYAALALVVGCLLAKLITHWFQKLLNWRKTDASIVSISGYVLYFILLTIAVMVALEQLGISSTSSFAHLLACISAVVLVILTSPHKKQLS